MNHKFWLIFITLVSFIVRIYQVDKVPLLWDEASIGYNAYSLIKTGKDEYGQSFPLIFKSFGDYKPGLYIYLTIPFIADLGLTPLAVRLPSIIIGSFTPLLLYLLVLSLTSSKKLSFCSAIILALNPFNILFSRGAWETNILTFELILASYLFIKSRFFGSALVFALTLYTYQGGKIMSPLLILSLFLFFKPSFKIFLFRFSLPLLILALPVAIGLFSGNDSNRLQVFSLLSYTNNLSDFVRSFFERYFNNFSPKYLIFQGDWQVARHTAPYIGVILYPSLFFLYLGLFKSILEINKPVFKFFLFWLLVAPLPSALTRDIIQPVRSMSFSIPLVFFISYGLSSLKNKFFILTSYFIYLISFLYFSDLLLNHFIKTKPQEHLYGYESAAKYLLANAPYKTDIYFSDFYGQPYIYYLFYSQYDPAIYQKHANLTLTGLDTGKVNQIDNIKFEAANFNSIKNKPRQLAIFSYDDAVRQGIDLKILTPLSPINNSSTFYGFQTQ